jgi:hypothetical protein
LLCSGLLEKKNPQSSRIMIEDFFALHFVDFPVKLKN